MGAYSYTTVNVDPDGTASVDVTLRPDERVSLLCMRDRGQLVISHAQAHVTITPTNPTAPTAEDLAVAHKLAELFARYAAEVERLHVLNGASVPGAPVDSAA
ncbi:hypothetical protein [Actinomadura livida]|uniref:Uncharacterized protein n=1 Tax=Actinomadura livida TaxID=79909 RepID=A0A7W7I9C3_9ACTN|nr:MULTISPECIES: hypothetical protein [Actinomadura]MBB4772917.1 hypothetical protein [Actinomadura catellatispora]GGU13654.1 hypothetical protein GCM10010208_43350 [Actinomadura livida]